MSHHCIPRIALRRLYHLSGLVVVLAFILATVLATILAGCGPAAPAHPAPLGDYATLEKLASAYTEVGEQYPMQPRMLPPPGRLEFIRKVFASAGFDYTATLAALARQGIDPGNKEHRDLAELVLLPHQGLAVAERETLYSSTEQEYIRAIEAALAQ